MVVSKTKDFNNRKNRIDEFNKNNRWHKKGVAIAVMKFPTIFFDMNSVYVCVYHNDGTVMVSHGGVEIGQGINTKVTQVVAHTLGIPLSFVKVRPTDNVIGANCAVTAASTTSEFVCLVRRLLYAIF